MALGYGLIALASSQRLAAIELDYRMENTALYLPVSPSRSDGMRPAEEVQDAQNLLLGSTLNVDKLMTSIQQPDDFNPQVLLRQLGDPQKPIQTVSPAHLKILGEIISQIQARTQAIRTASQVVENRLDLEIQEFQRQLKLLKECSSRISDLKNSFDRSRGDKVVEKHKQLGERLDKVLIVMTAEYRPQIGEAERKWFDEVERLKQRIRSSSATRVYGLASKAQVVS